MDEEENRSRVWATLCHLSALLFFVGIVPFGHLIGPLVVWLVKRHDYPSVEQHGKESLNFQISMTIYALVAIVLTFILIGIPLLIGLIIADMILVIVASVKTSNGEEFRYPCTIRLVQ